MLSFIHAKCTIIGLYAECHFAECHNDECHYNECHYTNAIIRMPLYECHYDECHYTNAIMTNASQNQNTAVTAFGNQYRYAEWGLLKCHWVKSCCAKFSYAKFSYAKFSYA